MHNLSIYAIVLVLGCQFSVAQAQSSQFESGAKLPPAKNGQPAFSFEGGKRVSVQKNRPDGFKEYSDTGSATAVGSGIVEIGRSGTRSGANVSPNRGITEAPIFPAASNTNSLSGINKGGPGGFSNPKALVVSKNQSAPHTSPASKAKSKPATTVVQILGPDGKMEYKEVPFRGSVTANRRAPNITQIKDADGKVKEYDWIKNNR